MSEVQQKDDYAANPNQKTFDMPIPPVDHEVNVVKIYFAKQVPKMTWEKKEETYAVKSGGMVSDVKKKYEKKGRRNIQADKEDSVKLKAKEEVKITWEEEVQAKKADGSPDFDFEKINSTTIKKKVWVVANCEGESGKLSVEIHENKLKNSENIYENPVRFLDGEEEKSKIEFTINGKLVYAKEITMRPKSDEDLKKLIDKINKRDDKNAFLYFKAEVTGTEDEVKFPDETHEFLNKDNERFEIRYCNCGNNYDITCTRYSKRYGPAYWGSKKLENYADWDTLIADNKITTEEKAILVGMSENEGKLDSVQSYDWDLSGEQMILTAGAMQKTVDHTGTGEFTTQVEEFKAQYPEKYDELFVSCGWTVDSGILYYKDPSDSKAEKITGNTLSNKIRENCKESLFGKTVECKPLQPIVNAVIDKTFQEKQVLDFIKRLKEVVLPLTPTGYSYKLSDYLKSKLGKATVLDHHINRPGFVKDDFGAALGRFFAKKDADTAKQNKTKKEGEKIEKLSRNPGDWGDMHGKYEQEILDDYGDARRGTDMDKRYEKMKKNSNLS
ncbi:hypothetical protein N0B40_15400 [Chryseobacterium oranimense]|uniref:hypothetical protein n=1 Tax=Chryseobacterium oranimense TaxID=421058 RepID=UPI0021B00E1D|nr:hypothetical protein [Chryseobacterium oranimense]UWX59793.1 hypothetical protein N0B40_15400 [Chryseobacterium oranimense]